MSTNLEFCMQTLTRNATGALVCDSSGVIRWANPTAAQCLGVADGELPGRRLERCLPGPAAAVGPDVYRHRFTDAAGERHWLQRTVSTLASEDGESLELSLMVDLSEFDARGRMRTAVVSGLEDSRLDPDTGVLRRRIILQELSSQISRGRRYANPLSVVMVRFSDCGQLDEGGIESSSTRETVAQCVNEALRWVDSVGTLSAGELLVVLPETGAESAEMVARKLNALCAKLELPASHAQLDHRLSYLEWSKELDVDAVLNALSTEPARQIAS